MKNSLAGPIFIGGLDRSGKTPLRLALSAHPRIALGRRIYFWTQIYNRYGDLGNPQNFERCLSDLLTKKSIRFLQVDADALRQQFAQGEPTYERLLALLHEPFATRLGKERWGMQETEVEQYASQIFAAFPTARIIHLIRDPRGRYGEIVLSQGGKRKMGQVGWATAEWRHSARLARENASRFPGRYHIVRYESLIAFPEETLREICIFLEEDFWPTMLTLEGALGLGEADETVVRTRPEWEAEGTALAGGHVQAVFPREVAFIQTYASREMKWFGYVPADLSLSRSEQTHYFLEWPLNFARLFL